MYNLKELYTSDTTLSQMIDWTPPSNELWGKIRSDPPPPWKSWKKLLSVRILYGPVRILCGPVRLLNRMRTERNFTTISIVQDRTECERDRSKGERDRTDGERDRADCERDRADCERDRADGERDRADCERKATSFTIFRGVGGQIEFSPLTRY